jgi:hypothetical protein
MTTPTNEIQRRIPPSFKKAAWRSTSPVDLHYEEIGISLTLEDGWVLRLRLSVADAKRLAESVASYLEDHAVRSHSEMSSGMPSTDVSIPDEGLKVCPPEMSSAACSGVA